MSQTVIKVENLYKEYKLGVINHGTLTHDLQSWWARMRGKEDPNSLISVHHNADAETDSFLALKDISFEVKQGERIGIIGKNGAGKSTILKILSKVTAPTKGNIKIKGRIASLLEVGTGFHPELTGRENIYLNGAILGMRKKEIDRKLDEIVDFSGVEKHIDTPVKRYSSGMNVRLGFAVAAHLEPEILIVDEVLAVGDAEFQKKAIGKMESVSKGEGRTILFVSHNMDAIIKLCNRSILLGAGKIMLDDNTDKVVLSYLNNDDNNCVRSLRDRRDRTGDGRLRFVKTWVEDENGNINSMVMPGKNMKIVAVYEIYGECLISNLSIAFGVYTILGVKLTDLCNTISGQYFKGPYGKSGRVECLIPSVPFNTGAYTYNIIARASVGIEDWIIGAGGFSVQSCDFFGSGYSVDPDHGVILVNHSFNIDV